MRLNSKGAHQIQYLDLEMITLKQDTNERDMSSDASQYVNVNHCQCFRKIIVHFVTITVIHLASNIVYDIDNDSVAVSNVYMIDCSCVFMLLKSYCCLFFVGVVLIKLVDTLSVLLLVFCKRPIHIYLYV